MSADNWAVCPRTEKYDHGPLVSYEITWANGHIEHIDAHQVIMPFDMPSLAGFAVTGGPKRWTFHGEIEGRWQLLLTAPEEAITGVRNVAHTRDEVQR